MSRLTASSSTPGNFPLKIAQRSLETSSTMLRSMTKIVGDKLSHVSFKINVTGEFGRWITENDYTTFVLSVKTQVRFDSDAEDPFGSIGCATMPFVDGAIHSTIKDRVDDLIADKNLHSTDVEHIYSIVDCLQVTSVDCD
jgi:hypothetical protein